MPHCGRGRTPALGCADGHAPLFALPGIGGTQSSPRRGPGRALAGAGWLARRGVQAQGPGPVDSGASRAAVSPPAPDCQQRVVPDPARVLGAESGLAGIGVEPSSAEQKTSARHMSTWSCSPRRSWTEVGSPARATGRRTGRRWATPAALPASPERPRPGSRTADRRRSWSTRWYAMRASSFARSTTGPTWRSQCEPWIPTRLGSLFECLHTVPEFRGTRGRRYPLATILAIAVAAKLAGYHGTRAFAEFASALTQHQLRALRAFYSHRLGRFTAPTTTTFFNILGGPAAASENQMQDGTAGAIGRLNDPRREQATGAALEGDNRLCTLRKNSIPDSRKLLRPRSHQASTLPTCGRRSRHESLVVP